MDRVLWVLGWILVALGLIVYLSWGLMYNAWTDIGLYSISAVLLAFGILGVLLAKVKNEENP